MSVLPFKKYNCHFSVYSQKVCNKGELSVIRHIVIRNEIGLVIHFTGLELCVGPYTAQLPKIGVRTSSDLVYVCQAINDILDVENIQSLSEITNEMVFAYLQRLCDRPKRSCDETYLSKQYLLKATKIVSFFFANLAYIVPASKIIPEELLRVEYYKRNRQASRLTKCYVPAFLPKRHHSYDRELLRDIPLKAVERLVQLAVIHDPMIAFAIVVQITTGLRPGEVMNLRQNASPLSNVDCVKITYEGTQPIDIKIDLTREYVLRSDGVSTGKIKKERQVTVFGAFIGEFHQAYLHHCKILEKYSCEAEYMPMFVAKGKAMTYQTYLRRLRSLITKYLQPELINSPNPLLAAYGHKLENCSFSPHTLRHAFTVRLVLEGLDYAQVMFYRGDSSPESALAYLQQKQELEEKLTGSHSSVIAALIEKGGEAY